GRSASRSVAWAATAHPTSPISRKARTAANSTANIRLSPRRSSQITTGPSTSVSSTARASGTKMRWPRYRAATTSPMLPRKKNVRRAVATAGKSPARSAMRRPPAEQPLDLAEQAGELDRLGVILVAAGGEGLLAVAGHGVGGQGDHRDVPG